MGQRRLFHNYCDAVEADIHAHPIQAAERLLLGHPQLLAQDLYWHCVCPYDAQGKPLPLDAPIADVRWLIYDNVYQRTRGGRAPSNARRDKGIRIGFHGRGRDYMQRTPELAADFWAGAIREFGLPRALGIDSEISGETGRVSPKRFVAPNNPDAPSFSDATAEVRVEPPEWASRLVLDVRKRWERSEGMYSTWASGFAVFYSPVPDDAGLVIIGENPGGGPAVFDPDRASQVPSQHDYFLYDYPLAERMRRLFDSAAATEALRSSVKVNLNFFRSSGRDEWAANTPSLRSELETYCLGAVHEVISRLNPKVVLCEGLKTFDRVVDLVYPSGSDRQTLAWTTWRRQRVRAYARAEGDGRCRIVGIIHPTGCGPAFVAAEEEISRLLAADLRQTRDEPT